MLRLVLNETVTERKRLLSCALLIREMTSTRCRGDISFAIRLTNTAKWRNKFSLSIIESKICHASAASF